MRKFISYLYLSVCFAALQAFAQTDNTELNYDVTPVQLPAKSFEVYIDSAGGLVLRSENGRYQIKGPIKDLWSDQMLTDIHSLSANVNSLDLKGFGFPSPDDQPIVVGNGPKIITLFSDPTCSSCRQLFTELEPLETIYTFHIFQVALLGPTSHKLARKIFCAPEKLAREATLSGNYDNLPDEKCNLKVFHARQELIEKVGVDVVPYIVSFDHRAHRGKPRDLAQWLSLSASNTPIGMATPHSMDQETKEKPFHSSWGSDTL